MNRAVLILLFLLIGLPICANADEKAFPEIKSLKTIDAIMDAQSMGFIFESIDNKLVMIQITYPKDQKTKLEGIVWFKKNPAGVGWIDLTPLPFGDPSSKDATLKLITFLEKNETLPFSVQKKIVKLCSLLVANKEVPYTYWLSDINDIPLWRILPDDISNMPAQ
jgi:hypothetical protein